VSIDGGGDDADTGGGSAVDAQSPDATVADAQALPPVDGGTASDAGIGASFQCPAGSVCSLGTVAAPDCVP
jgi:hypothetical protein